MMSNSVYAQKYGTPATGSITYDRSASARYRVSLYNGYVTEFKRLATAYDMNNMIASMKKSVADFELQTQGGSNIYQQISNSFNENKADFTLGDGVRIAAFNMIGNYSVRQIAGKYYFSASAAGTTTIKNEAEVTFRGSASLIVNGKQVGQTPFIYGDGYNVKYPKGYSNLGGLSMQLPTSGTVMINLQFSYHIDFGSAGLRHSSTMSIPIYIRTIGLPRD